MPTVGIRLCHSSSGSVRAAFANGTGTTKSQPSGGAGLPVAGTDVDG